MNFNIISWNIRGWGNDLRRMDIRNGLRKLKPNIAILQETKREEIDEAEVRNIWRDNDMDWCALPSIGRSGGILVIWNPSMFEMSEPLLGAFSVSMKVKTLVDDFEWVLTGVYGPNLPGQRSHFFQELVDVQAMWQLPWVLAGDFNTIRYSHEKNSYTRITNCIRKFSSFIDNNDLVDLPLTGARFTWSNENSHSRLDRFIISLDWESRYPSSTQIGNSKFMSDD